MPFNRVEAMYKNLATLIDETAELTSQKVGNVVSYYAVPTDSMKKRTRRIPFNNKSLIVHDFDCFLLDPLLNSIHAHFNLMN